MDLHEIAQIIAGPAPALRFRQATVVSVQYDGTFTATIAGSTVSVTGILALSHVCPNPGHGIWLATDGIDVFAIGTMGAIGATYCIAAPSSPAEIADSTDTAAPRSGPRRRRAILRPPAGVPRVRRPRAL